MSADSSASFEEVLAALGRKLDRDPELQCLLSQVLARFTAEVPETRDEGTLTTEEEPRDEPAIAALAGIASPLPPANLASYEQLSSLVQDSKRGLSLRPAPPPPTRRAGPAPIATIRQRLQLKHQATEIARERAEARLRGEPVAAPGRSFNEVIARAKTQPNCYLWMCNPEHNSVPPASWAEAGQCFSVLLRALTVFEEAQRTPDNHDSIAPALHLLAEAQSAVRTASSSLNVEDADQMDLYLHLLDWSGSEQIFITRYMRADDRADPARWQNLSVRVDALAQKIAGVDAARKSRSELLGKIRYEAGVLGRNPLQPMDNWGKIITSVDQIISAGLPPSNAGLRTMLVRHLDDMPAELELPENFRRFLHEVDTHLATQEPGAAAPQESRAPTLEVQKVAAFLSGSQVVIIGGDCRHEARRSMISAFGLADLNWIETRAHQTSSQFESAVARDNVKLVLLAIRWSSHSFGDVKTFCDRYSKPLVRLPRGYGVNQMAVEICNQCRLL